MTTALSGPMAPYDHSRTLAAPSEAQNDGAQDARAGSVSASTGLEQPSKAITALANAEHTARPSNDGDQSGTAKADLAQETKNSLLQPDPATPADLVEIRTQQEDTREAAGPLRSFVEVPTELTKKIQKARDAIAAQGGGVAAMQSLMREMAEHNEDQTMDRLI